MALILAAYESAALALTGVTERRWEPLTRSIPWRRMAAESVCGATPSRLASARDAAMMWMIDRQDGRRNPSDIDRIATATKREAIVARMAKTRQATSTGGAEPQLVPKSTQAAPPVKARKEAAKSAGVGTSKYEEGKVILEAASTGEIAPEVLEEVRAGKASIHKVSKEIKEKRQAAKVAKAEAATPRPSERTGDLKKIEDTMGEDFARSVEIGTLLKTAAEMKAFLALETEDKQAICDYLLRGWTVAHSIRFILRVIDHDTRIADLINLCIQQKGSFVTEVGAYTITTNFTADI